MYSKSMLAVVGKGFSGVVTCVEEKIGTYFLGIGMIGQGRLVKQREPWKEPIPAFLPLSGSGAPQTL